MPDLNLVQSPRHRPRPGKHALHRTPLHAVSEQASKHGYGSSSQLPRLVSYLHSPSPIHPLVKTLTTRHLPSSPLLSSLTSTPTGAGCCLFFPPRRHLIPQSVAGANNTTRFDTLWDGSLVFTSLLCCYSHHHPFLLPFTSSSTVGMDRLLRCF